MGVVFRGVNLAMDKQVAIKMIRQEAFATPDALDRFTREAKVWSQLNHPAITQVFDFGVQDKMPFLVMELVEGTDLSDVLKSERVLAPHRAVSLMRQLAAALEEAHRLGVVHRDIKPHARTSGGSDEEMPPARSAERLPDASLASPRPCRSPARADFFWTVQSGNTMLFTGRSPVLRVTTGSHGAYQRIRA